MTGKAPKPTNAAPYSGSHRFAVAPMMDWTDRHCRLLHRPLTRHALLYTEMVTAGAVLHGDRERLLGFARGASGGAAARRLRPGRLAEAARDRRGFRLRRDQPQRRLSIGPGAEGRFGACLMAEPELVADCVAAMRAAVQRPGHRQVPHRRRRAGSRRRSRPSSTGRRRRAARRSSCTRARHG